MVACSMQTCQRVLNSWRLQPGMSRMKLAGARAGRQDEKLTWQTFFAFATSWQMMVLLYRASLPGRHLNFVYGRPEMWHSPPYSICGSTAGQVSRRWLIEGCGAHPLWHWLPR